MGPPPEPQEGATRDPSMEDILASIRRILSEDETHAAPPPVAPPQAVQAGPGLAAPDSATPVPAKSTGAAPASAEPDVLVLNEDMLVPEPMPLEVPPVAERARPEPGVAAPVLASPPPIAPPPAYPPLIARDAATAAANSVGELVRTLAHERASSVYRGGPTIEDVVRDEMRPLLKAWLDEHLPAMVERLVRTEIERVVGRATP